MTTFNNYSEEQINKILTNYKNKRDRENKYYHDVTKNSEDFKIKNRERAKAHYHNKGKDMKKVLILDFIIRGIKKKDNIEGFKEKHFDKYQLLLNSTVIN